MEKIETLDELRAYLAAVMARGMAQIKEVHVATNRLGSDVELTGWKNLRTVLTTHEKNGLRFCARQDKKDGETELLVLRKTLVLEGGPTGKDWVRITVKSAAWLEKRGLYPNRHVITDITPSMFEAKP